MRNATPKEIIESNGYAIEMHPRYFKVTKGDFSYLEVCDATYEKALAAMFNKKYISLETIKLRAYTQSIQHIEDPYYEVEKLGFVIFKVELFYGDIIIFDVLPAEIELPSWLERLGS